MRKFLCIVLSLAIVASCVAMLTFTANAAAALSVDFEGENPFCAPVGGEIAIVDGGKSGKCLQFTEASQNNWPAPFLTVEATKAALKKAGKYKMEFDIKYDVVPAYVTLNGFAITFRGEGARIISSSVASSKTLEANTWGHISAEFLIEAEDLNKESTLGFDHMDYEANTILIDNFTITLVEEAVVEPTVAPELVNAYKVPALACDMGFLIHKPAGITTVPDGDFTVSYDVMNPNAYDIIVCVHMQTGKDGENGCSGAGWRAVLNNEDKPITENDCFVTIPAGEIKTVSYTCPVKNNKVKCSECKGEHDVSTLWIRFDAKKDKDNNLADSDSFIILKTGDAAKDGYLQKLVEGYKKIVGAHVDKPEASATAAPTTAPTAAPTAKPAATPKVVDAVEVKVDGMDMGMLIHKPAGITTLPDGDFTISYEVKNPNAFDIKACVHMQTGKDGENGCTGAGWRAILDKNGEKITEDVCYVTIPAGQTKKVSFTCPVKDNKVKCSECNGEHDVSTLWIRFDVHKNDDANTNLDKTDSFIILKTGNEAMDGYLQVLVNGYANVTATTVEIPVASGDMLPVALIACVAIAAVALVVVSKKKED